MDQIEKDKLENVASFIEESLLGESNLKLRLLFVYRQVVGLLMREQPTPTEPLSAERFCVALPSKQVLIRDVYPYPGEEARGRYVATPERFVYFINGFITESKILALKEVRTRDQSSLKEAKDIVDALQTNARQVS